MSFQIMTKAQCLGPGHDIWAIPRDNRPQVIGKLDWYLNFQLSRASHHKPRELSSDLNLILRENEMSVKPSIAKPELPLMVKADQSIPARIVIDVPLSSQFNQWVKFIHKLWIDLEKPKARIFLPKDATIESFEKFWPETPSPDIGLVAQV